MEKLVKSALSGDKKALDTLINKFKDRVYNLSLRMLWNPHDAEEAAQEIMIKIITNLNTFKEKSKFSTWVYSVASNYLLTAKKKILENPVLSFEVYSDSLNSEFEMDIPDKKYSVDRKLLEEEVRIGCTHAMLLCFNRKNRIVFILHEIFGINSTEGAEILNIKPEAFRKRLSRAKELLRNFMSENCGLINPECRCMCGRRIEIAEKMKRLNPEKLIFAKYSEEERNDVIKELNELDSIAALYRSNPFYKAPMKITEKLKNILELKNYRILEYD